MPVLDFKEIAAAGTGTGHQDAFEQFTREFLGFLGFDIEVGPARGPDLGRDLVVLEDRKGVAGLTRVRWLVSCKHKAHSGEAVGISDEQNVLDRVRAHGCSGFLGVYSTIASEPMAEILRRHTRESGIEARTFDGEEIERLLLTHVGDAGLAIARRWFPRSMASWSRPALTSTDIMVEEVPLLCDNCGTDLLHPVSGIYVQLTRYERGRQASAPESILGFFTSCKGPCDRTLVASLRARHPGVTVIDGWEDIDDMCIPTVFLVRLLAFMNGFHRGDRWDPEAYRKFRAMILALFPLVSRGLGPEDRTRVRGLLSIPGAIGGLGE